MTINKLTKKEVKAWRETAMDYTGNTDFYNSRAYGIHRLNDVYYATFVRLSAGGNGYDTFDVFVISEELFNKAYEALQNVCNPYNSYGELMALETVLGEWLYPDYE